MIDEINPIPVFVHIESIENQGYGVGIHPAKYIEEDGTMDLSMEGMSGEESIGSIKTLSLALVTLIRRVEGQAPEIKGKLMSQVMENIGEAYVTQGFEVSNEDDTRSSKESRDSSEQDNAGEPSIEGEA